MTTTLTTPSQQVSRVKYFRIPIHCTNMLPTTTYTVTINGVNIGPWCQPLNGILGGPLTSDNKGQLKFTYMLSIPYNTTFLTNPVISAGLINNLKMITFTDPLGQSSVSYLPITMKSAI